ncbi:hypothetical protein TanjilG_04265 [Lupinus angustifolius]|uniref:Uncharacterized protein n=1 Tax=Lupinus angustifolius TaxID=3871 RepID=A0A4P1RPJ5_LUPAN|nr:hypothetical protein TanjilG_04265 [Lupinus angustifolius]
MAESVSLDMERIYLGGKLNIIIHIVPLELPQEFFQLGAASICHDDHIPSAEDLADQIIEVLNYFGLGAVMCMGVTAGAYILSLFAIKYRDRVLGLILVSPLCKAPSWTEWIFNKVMSNLLYFYGVCGLLKECLLQRYFSKEVRGNAEVPESEIVEACRKLLDERKSVNVLRFLHAINQRPDITEGLKRLKCRTLVFVGDSSPFHSEALHMTSKLDRRYSALVEISEYQIIEMAENICNLKKAEADWILRIDIVEKEDRLELVEQDSEGQCNSECKTIERACQEVMGYSDTDVAEYLYKSKPDVDSLLNYLCKDLTKACSKKPPPVPKDRTPGEPFVAKSDKEAEMEKLLKSMEGMPGAPGMKMYSRDDLMNKNLGDEDADDEDEDDDEADLPSKLGKVLREKESGKGDWKQVIIKGIADTSTTLKKHADRVSNRIRKWWQGKKTTTTKKGSKAWKSEL